VTEIIANDVQFLEPRGAGGGGNAGGSASPARAGGSNDDIPAPDDAPRDVDPDEIPF
jgi:single-stranded DNA-binding protein